MLVISFEFVEIDILNNLLENVLEAVGRFTVVRKGPKSSYLLKPWQIGVSLKVEVWGETINKI